MLTVMAALCLVQAAPLANSKPPIQRVFRRKQSETYAVAIESEEPAGTLRYEFQLKTLVDHTVEQSTDVAVRFMFLNLKEMVNDDEAPLRKTFGSASYRMPVSGFPQDFSFAGGSPFMIPVLSWWTSFDAVGADGSFKVPEMVFDGAIQISGAGSYHSENDKTGSVTLDLSLKSSAKAKQFSADGSTFHSVAVFNLATGVLLKSDGEMKRPDGGSMSFHIKKV